MPGLFSRTRTIYSTVVQLLVDVLKLFSKLAQPGLVSMEIVLYCNGTIPRFPVEIIAITFYANKPEGLKRTNAVQMRENDY